MLRPLSLCSALSPSRRPRPPPPPPPPPPPERNSPLRAPGPDRSFPDSLSVSIVRGRHSDPPSTSTSATRLAPASSVASRGAERARPASDARQLRSMNLGRFSWCVAFIVRVLFRRREGEVRDGFKCAAARIAKSVFIGYYEARHLFVATLVWRCCKTFVNSHLFFEKGKKISTHRHRSSSSLGMPSSDSKPLSARLSDLRPLYAARGLWGLSVPAAAVSR